MTDDWRRRGDGSWRVITSGITRTVVLVGPWAFKFPRCSEWRLFLQGLLANMQEKRFSGAEGFEYCCPVRFAIPGGFLVVMPRARPLEDEALIPTGDHIAERKLDSWGWLNGRVVAVDYGN